MGLGARLFEFRRHQDPRVANESKLKFDRTAVLYVKYVVDTFLFLIISFQMVEALLEEAQEDITPEVGSEVILVDEAGETPGTLHNLDDFLFRRPRCDSCSVMHLCGVPAKEKQ